MDLSSVCGTWVSRIASFVVTFWLLPFLLLTVAIPGTVRSSAVPSFFLRVSSGVYRPSNATFYLKSINDSGVADAAIAYGTPGDRPITGDWNGDGIDTVGVYRAGVFYLRNSNTSGFADGVVPFGRPGDLPVVGDWDGDGIDTIGVYRNGVFFLRNANTPGPADLVLAYGAPGDMPLAGDWTGKGYDSVGLYRPSDVDLLPEEHQCQRLRRYGCPVWDTGRSTRGR